MALLADAAGRDVVLWHVHHGLRPEADDDAELVEKLAATLGRPFELRRVDVAPGPGLEARARAARYAALPPDVCVAHTADDRAETVLLNLFRGAGPAGVAAPFDLVHRPLLRLRRHETQALCDSAGAAVTADPMNDDESFSRVAVRNRLLPAIAELLGRDPVPLLVRHADLTADALAVVRDAAALIDPTDAAALRAAPRAVAGEAVRRWLMAETGAALAVDAASVERVLDVARGIHVATEVTGGHRVARTAGRLRVEG
jgi:tRNA(Ile)-lysidine synthase